MSFILATGLPFLILMLFGPWLIKILKVLNFGQQIREVGPDHQQKEGIPTMGGILIILAIIIASIIVLDITSHIIWVVIITTGMGLIGFIDDIIKVKTSKSLGLKAREKLIGQVLLGLLLGVYVYYYSEIGNAVIMPFLGTEIDLGIFKIPFCIFIVTGFANAVNLTDGLDGLASGVTVIVAVSMSLLASAMGYIQIALFGLILAGACLGFVWFNSYPAQVFMGDVGSLALGGALASMAILSRTELFLVIIGGVYVIETVSVMIQVIYYKLTGGKRIFKMSPIHHHYELTGLAETKVVARFWIVSIIFALMGLTGFYII